MVRVVNLAHEVGERELQLMRPQLAGGRSPLSADMKRMSAGTPPPCSGATRAKST
jgi:hypothetical protein